MKALVRAELRQRVRGKRWWVMLLLWVAALFLLMLPITSGASNQGTHPNFEQGPTVFGGLALTILGLTCLLVPSLAATSINSERDRGTLAVLQATTLRATEIVGAKFAAGLMITGAFLAASIPLTVWAYLYGGVGIGRVAIVYLVLFVIASVLLALSLAASALLRKAGASAMVSYGLVFLLTIGTLILYGLSFFIWERQDVFQSVPTDVIIEPGDDPFFPEQQRNATPRWMIMSPNPFIVLADAAPRSGPTRQEYTDPLESIRDSVRDARYEGFGFIVQEEEPAPVWPVGLLIEILLAGTAFWLAVRRLRVPARKLQPGERVA